MIRKFINAVPLIAVALVGVALNQTPTFTKAPHHTQLKIAVIVAVCWLIAQIIAAVITRQPQGTQQTAQRRGTRQRRRSQQDTPGYWYPGRG